MKNKLLCLLLVMCIMFPATLFLNACKKKDDEDNSPQPPTAMEIFNTANTHLDTILDNATVTIVPTAIVTTGFMKKYGGDDCTITLKTQHTKAEIFVPETLSGVDNSKIYFDGMGNYYTESDKIDYPMVMATEGYHVSSYIEEVVQLNKLVQKISDIAHFYSSAPLKLEEKDGNRYLSLDLDIGTKLNNAFILNYKTNCDEPIALFIA